MMKQRIFLQVGKVHFTSRLDHVRVLLDEKPPHVGEEESTSGVVWVSIGFRVLVMDAMVAGPVENGSLVSN
jgi:hypothetical protein